MTKLSNNYNLQKLYPDLAKEWHPTKNDTLTPKDVTPNSVKKVWWLCRKNNNHEWKATINNRNRGTDCPYCSGKKVCTDNCLKTVNPKLAKEWHPIKNNSLTPKDVTPNSGKKVWWLCSKNKSHEWETAIYTRNNGIGCPYCAGKKVCTDNCLKTVNPKLAREWHPTKNGSLTPKDVTPNSGKKIWWLCSKNNNHEWETTVDKRSSGRGCPYCFSQTSELELRVYTEMKYVFQDFCDVKHRKKPFGYECDVYIPKIKLGIEIDWVYTHFELPKKKKKDKYRSDKEKTEGLSKNGITLLRLREKGLKRISDNDILWTSKMLHHNICCSVLERILDSQKLDDDLVSRIKDYINGGKIQNDIEFVNLLDMLPSPLFPEDSLEYCNKALAKEWYQTRNGSLTPRDVTPNAHRKVWWRCSKNKNHEWQAIIKDRNRGRNCPYCAGKKVCTDNCLKTVNPKLAKEWHPTKNGSLTPKDVTPNSHKKVWWVCSTGHKWEAAISSRNRGSDCPYCSGQKVCIDNCLKTVNPKLAKEWHPTKNGKLKPKDVTPNSHKKVWWVCSTGHKWEAAISSRNRGSGCPYCFKKRRQHRHRRFKSLTLGK